MGQSAAGGWPAFWAADLPSVDATCFRLAELDDLGALDRPPARAAVAWLLSRQRPDGTWQEDPALADLAPPWATPGDPEATLYLTANTGFWLVVAGPAADAPPAEANHHAEVIARATQAFRASLSPTGAWPSFLVTGWLGAALLYKCGWFYEASQIQSILTRRLPQMTPADACWLAAAFRRVGVPPTDDVMVAARRRLTDTQRSDGGWTSDDGEVFDVHTTLAGIRGMR
jgi:hypothetical protein